jgi:plasmid maintenance system killer protein
VATALANGSVSIFGNWRVIFEFEGQYVTIVDLVDYH